MAYPFDPNGSPPPADSGANRPPYDAPPGQYPPYPPASPYPGAPQPPVGYPTQPQGYPYPYGTYPQPYGPGYPPPQQPRQGNTTLWVVLGIVAVVVIGACVGCAVLAGSIFSTVSRAVQQYYQPLLVVEGFCNDEMHADYASAYSALSPSQQANITSDQFVAQSTARDASEGAVTACDVNISGTNGISASSTSATIGLTMTRSSAGTFVGSLTLIKSGSTWTIDQIDPALPILTDGTPTEQGTATPTV